MAERAFPTVDDAERGALASRERAVQSIERGDSPEYVAMHVALAQVDATLALVARLRGGFPVDTYDRSRG